MTDFAKEARDLYDGLIHKSYPGSTNIDAIEVLARCMYDAGVSAGLAQAAEIAQRVASERPYSIATIVETILAAAPVQNEPSAVLPEAFADRSPKV